MGLKILKTKKKHVAKWRKGQERLSWDHYFMRFALLAKQRATCIRRGVGAVIVKEKHVLTTGYNGAPKGLSHAEDVGCLREELQIPSGTRHEICRGLHAEQNAIVQAAYHGVSINGADIYITNHPCSICAKMLINAGIQRVFYLDGYADPVSKMIIEESHLELIQMKAQDFVDEEKSTC